MSNQSIQTVAALKDKVMLSFAVLLLLVGVAGYGLLPAIIPGAGDSESVAVLVVGVVAGGALALFSGYGRRFIAFTKDSYAEMRRVVWPSRQETVMTTGIVFAFVVVLALFLWLTDKSIEWILYDLIFGWK